MTIKAEDFKNASANSLAGNVDYCIDMLSQCGIFIVKNFVGDYEKTKPLGRFVFFGNNEFTYNQPSLIILDNEDAVKELAFTIMQKLVEQSIENIIEEMMEGTI